MLSAYIPVILTPIDFRVAKLMGFAYLVLALLVHHDQFTWSRYHQNHHYLVVKNYGSHIPMFDWYFNTWQVEPYYPKSQTESDSEIKAKRTGN